VLGLKQSLESFLESVPLNFSADEAAATFQSLYNSIPKSDAGTNILLPYNEKVAYTPIDGVNIDCNAHLPQQYLIDVKDYYRPHVLEGYVVGPRSSRTRTVMTR
jgi:hypothetical protein